MLNAGILLHYRSKPKPCVLYEHTPQREVMGNLAKLEKIQEKKEFQARKVRSSQDLQLEKNRKTKQNQRKKWRKSR